MTVIITAIAIAITILSISGRACLRAEEERLKFEKQALGNGRKPTIDTIVARVGSSKYFLVQPKRMMMSTCKHEHTEPLTLSSGGGVFADVWKYDVCMRCGKKTTSKQVW